MRTRPCVSPSTTASWPRGPTKRIACGLTAVPLDGFTSDVVSGAKLPRIEYLQVISRALSVWSPYPAGFPHPAHMTNENIGFRIAKGLSRSNDGALAAVH